MTRTNWGRLLVGCLLYFLLGVSFAADGGGSEWRHWVTTQVNAHPEIVAAREAMNAELAMADQLQRPIYNPELFGGYEREGDANNWRVGVGQTFDLNGRRGAQEERAVAVRDSARQTFDLTWQQKAAQVLNALVSRQAAWERYELAIEQQAQLDELIELVEQRSRAGDIGQIDVELTLLSLSRRLNETALALAGFQSATAVVKELLPQWDPARIEVPEPFWALEMPETSEELLLAHPGAQAARAIWQSLEQAAEVADRERKSEPTIALEGGQEGDDNVIGIAIAFPLMVRNNYDDQVRSSRQAAMAARAEYKATVRRLRFAVEASAAVARQYREQYGRWLSVSAGSREASGNLLVRQWEEGDLGTNEYLLILQQRIDGLIAGIELTENYRLSIVEWLVTTGRMSEYLSSASRITSEQEL